MNPTVSVTFKALDKTKTVFASITRRTGVMGSMLSGATKMVRQFNSALGQVPTVAFAGLAGGLTIFTKSVIESQMRVDSLKNSLLVAKGSAMGAEVEFNRLVDMSEELGLSFEAVADTFKKFGIAAKAAGMSAAETDKIYRSASRASVAMGLSTENTRLTLKALEQMMSKGTVQAEELRGQFGEHIPGAFDMAAKAMGITTQEFNKLMENGQILAKDLLPKLADEMDRTFGPGFEKALGQTRAALNKLQTQFDLFKQAVAESGIAKIFADIVNSMAEKLKEWRKSVDDTALALIKFVKENKEQWIKAANNALTAINKILLGLQTFINFVGKAIGSLENFAIAMAAIAGASAGAVAGPWGAAVGAITGAVAAYVALNTEMGNTTATAKEMQAIQIPLLEGGNDYLVMLEQMIIENQVLSEKVVLVKEYLRQLKGSFDAQKELQAMFKSVISARKNDLISMEDAREQILAIADAYKLYAQEAYTASDANKVVSDTVKGMQEGLTAYHTETTKSVGIVKTVKDATVNAFKSMEDAIVEMAQTGKISFKSMANSILADIYRIQVRKTITGPLAGMANSFFEGFDFGRLFKANGGPVAAGSPYIVGERGPELFMPGRSGTIVPNNQLAAAPAAPQPVQITYNIQSWDSRDTMIAIQQSAPQIVGIVQNAFNKRGRRGPMG